MISYNLAGKTFCKVIFYVNFKIGLFFLTLLYRYIIMLVCCGRIRFFKLIDKNKNVT